MTIAFLILAPLRQTFLYDALWWQWVSMFIVHVPLLVMELIAFVVFSWYNWKLHQEGMSTRERVVHVPLMVFPVTLAITHLCTIATASWWFLMPAALPLTCAFVFGVALVNQERRAEVNNSLAFS